MRRVKDSVLDPGRRLLESIPAAGQVIDEIAMGVAWTAPDGAVVHANPVAQALLDGPAGGAIREMLREMTARAAASGGYLEAHVRTRAGEVRLLLAQGGGEGFIAFLERDTERAHRTQVKILRSMLASVCEGGSIASAAGGALVSLAWAIPGTLLVIYELDEPSRSLVAIAQARVPPSRAAVLSPQSLDGDSAVARAVRSAAPYRILSEPLVGPPEVALALPVKAGGKALGALLAAGSPCVLGEAELRLLQGMADAVASLFARERQETSLRQEQRTRKRLEERGERARHVEVQREGLATVGRLTACVTHEMNGPLAFMRSNLKVLGEHAERLGQLAARGPAELGLPEIAGDAAEIVSECLEGLDRLAAILQSLRGLVRDPAERVRFEAARPLQEAVDVFRRARRGQCEVTCSLGGDLPDLEGSPAILSHVALNLLENGLEAMGGSGSLEVRAFRSGSCLRLEVEDRGPGIPGDVSARLFEPYFSTKPVGKGTGLGLFVCRELVSQMGGRIGFDTGDGGTVFHVELPAA
jgi:signal transduction histidine kinase